MNDATLGQFEHLLQMSRDVFKDMKKLINENKMPEARRRS